MAEAPILREKQPVADIKIAAPAITVATTPESITHQAQQAIKDQVEQAGQNPGSISPQYEADEVLKKVEQAGGVVIDMTEHATKFGENLAKGATGDEQNRYITKQEGKARLEFLGRVAKRAKSVGLIQRLTEGWRGKKAA